MKKEQTGTPGLFRIVDEKGRTKGYFARVRFRLRGKVVEWSRKCKTRRPAEQALREFKDKAARVQTGRQQRHRPERLGEVAAAFIDDRVHDVEIDDRTGAKLSGYADPKAMQRLIERGVDHFGEDTKLHTITPAELLDFALALKRLSVEFRTRKGDTVVTVKKRNGQRSTSNVIHHLNALRAVVRYAVEKRWLVASESPFVGFTPPDWLKASADKPQGRVITADEQRKLLDLCVDREVDRIRTEDSGKRRRLHYFERRSHLRPVLIALFDTGRRKSELLGMTWRDVDFTTRTITVRRGKSKTGQRDVIRLTKRLAIELERMKRERRPGPNDAIFVYTPDGATEPRPLKDFKRAWRTLLKEAGIEGPVRIHDVRHTVISRLSDAGLPATAVADLVGHSDPATTSRHYSHATEEGRAKVLEALESIGTTEVN